MRELVCRVAAVLVLASLSNSRCAHLPQCLTQSARLGRVLRRLTQRERQAVFRGSATGSRRVAQPETTRLAALQSQLAQDGSAVVLAALAVTARRGRRAAHRVVSLLHRARLREELYALAAAAVVVVIARMALEALAGLAVQPQEQRVPTLRATAAAVVVVVLAARLLATAATVRLDTS